MDRSTMTRDVARGRVTTRNRLVRAGLAAAACTGASLYAHAVGGGHLPAAEPLVVLAVLSFTLTLVVANALAGRRLGPGRVVALVGIAQLGYHGVLSVLPAGTAAPAAATPHVGHLHHATLPVGPPTTHVTHDMSPAMLAAHTCAAVLVAIAITHGERLFWLLHDGVLAPLITWLDFRPVPVSVASRPVPTRAATIPVAAPRRSSPPLRGPPMMRVRGVPA